MDAVTQMLFASEHLKVDKKDGYGDLAAYLHRVNAGQQILGFWPTTMETELS